jgi:dipeptidyl aminopeptidase/acylaminoacyl peptidase
MTRLVIVVALAAASAMLSAVSTPATVPGANGKIAFVEDHESVYVVGADGSGLKRIGEGASPAWSPDGRRLVLFRRTTGPCAPCNFALDVIDIDNGRRATIFEGTAFDPAPAWSPSGTEIAFVNQRAKALDNDIWLVRPDGTNPRQVTTTGTAYGPAWSPHGGRLAFYGFSPDDRFHLYTVNSDGSGLRQLTSGNGFDITPSWSPDGTRMAFMSDRGGSFELYVMDAGGGGTRALTSGGLPSTCQAGCTFPRSNPSWSPDGRLIAFSSDLDGRLYIVPASGGAATRVPGGLDFFGDDPDWQPTVDLRVRKLKSPRSLRVGYRATLRFRMSNAGPRDATAVRATITVDRHLVVVSTSAATKTIRIGASADITAVVRARRPGPAVVRLVVSAAEADATAPDNSAVARLVVAPSAP